MQITLGRIGRVHGIKGWLRLISFTEPADNILEYHSFSAQLQGKSLILQMDDVQPQGKAYIAHFVGFDNPESARELTGLELQVSVDTLPVLADGDYYWHQLQGLRVRNLQGEDLGSITGMLATGANDVLVVKGDLQSIDRRERLIPYLDTAVVKTVDLEEGWVTVDWQADYLA